MKKICNFLKNLIIFAYILLIIFVTISLLSYNDYKITEFGNKSLIPVIDANLEPDFRLGDLVIADKGDISEIVKDDMILFYRTFAGDATINYTKVKSVEKVSDTQYNITVDGDYKFSSDYYIGGLKNTSVVPNVGRVLHLLQSKWGFLFLGVFPSLLVFLYTLYTVILEFRGHEVEYEDDEDDKPKEKKKNTSKKSQKDEEKKNDDKVEEKGEKIDKEKEVAEKKKSKETETKEEKREEKENIEEKKEEETEEKVENKKEEKTENKVEEKEVIEEKEEKVETVEKSKEEKPEKKVDKKQMTEEQKKALIEAKLKSMTEEEKKALLQAKLNSMTEEEKRALIEAKKKKMEEQKNK